MGRAAGEGRTAAVTADLPELFYGFFACGLAGLTLMS